MDPEYSAFAKGARPVVVSEEVTVTKCEPTGQLLLAVVHDDNGADDTHKQESLRSEPLSL